MKNYNWIECPPDYEFSIGERIKMNPMSRYVNQSYDVEKLGTIVKKMVHDDCWVVEWDSGNKGCYYWRKDLLINQELSKEYLEKKKLLKLKYKDIDPFEEENWMPIYK